MTVTTITDAELTPKDYASDQEVRWCAGCGDYAILKAVQKALAELGAPRERTVLGLLAQGRSKREIAQELGVSFNTVHSHTKAIYRKLGVSSRHEAVERASEITLR